MNVLPVIQPSIGNCQPQVVFAWMDIMMMAHQNNAKLVIILGI